MVKRCFDFIVALIGTVVLAPLMGLVASGVSITTEGSIFFRQTRPGLMGKPFEIIKFRTMNQKKDGRGELLPDEDRITPFGRFLRSYSLDELPEFLNVLKGHMSLVGPRPLLMHYLDRYTPEQMRRHQVKPGITGWAQVNGRNAISWDDKFKLDLWYVDHRSFRLDIKIIILTIWKTIKREGITQIGRPTSEEFKGSVGES